LEQPVVSDAWSPSNIIYFSVCATSKASKPEKASKPDPGIENIGDIHASLGILVRLKAVLVRPKAHLVRPKMHLVRPKAVLVRLKAHLVRPKTQLDATAKNSLGWGRNSRYTATFFVSFLAEVFLLQRVEAQRRL
jgi:hypothetical protein